MTYCPLSIFDCQECNHAEFAIPDYGKGGVSPPYFVVPSLKSDRFMHEEEMMIEGLGLLGNPRGSYGATTREEERKEEEMSLPVCLGKDVQGREVVLDVAKAPHVLVCVPDSCNFMTVFANAMLAEKTPIHLVLLGKRFKEFDGRAQMALPSVLGIDLSFRVLDAMARELENRYRQLEEVHARNIQDYRKQSGAQLPFLVVVIDDFMRLVEADRARFGTLIRTITSMGRSVGIHMVLATSWIGEDPLSDIRTNIPTTITCKVSAPWESMLLLDQEGAEHLGKGEMYYRNNWGKVIKVIPESQ